MVGFCRGVFRYFLDFGFKFIYYSIDFRIVQSFPCSAGIESWRGVLGVELRV